MTEPWQNLLQIAADVGRLLLPLLQLVAQWLLLIVWAAWWLWAVNWRRVWPVLAEGAWAPALLILILAALAWSMIVPGDLAVPGVGRVGNFWWQLGAVGLLAGLALFCGWLQGVFGWAPREQPAVSAEVPGHGHEHPVGTRHGHDHAHGGHH